MDSDGGVLHMERGWLQNKLKINWSEDDSAISFKLLKSNFL